MLVLPRRSAPQLRQAVSIAQSVGAVRAVSTGRARQVGPSSSKLTSDRVLSASTTGCVLGSSSTRRAPSLAARLSASQPSKRHNSTLTPTETEPSSSSPPTSRTSDAQADVSPSEPSPPPSESTPYAHAVARLAAFQSTSPPPTPQQYEQLINELTRPGRIAPSAVPLVEGAYSQMLDQAVHPTDATLAQMIRFLCRRDARLKEHRPNQGFEPQVKGRLGMSDRPQAAFQSAVALFRASTSASEDRQAVAFGTDVYEDLLAAAVRHKDAQTARELFVDLDARSEAAPVEGLSPVQVTYGAFASMIEAFSNANATAVRVAFEAFKAKELSGKMDDAVDTVKRSGRRSAVWTAAIKAYLQCGDGSSAQELFAQAMAARRPSPSPSPSPSAEAVEEAETAGGLSGMDGARLLKDLFAGPGRSKLRRQHLQGFVAAAIPSDDLVRAAIVRAAIEIEADNNSAVGICNVLRAHQSQDPQASEKVVDRGLRALFALPRLEPRHFAFGYELAQKRLEQGHAIPYIAGGAIVARLAEPSTSEGATVDEITSFHRQAIASQFIDNYGKMSYHRRVMYALLKDTLSSPVRQLELFVALTATAGDDKGTFSMPPRADHVGALKEVYTKARAELDGDISRLGLTSSTVAILLDALAAADEAATESSRTGNVLARSASRRPQLSLVESFVKDLIAIGDGLGEISLPYHRTLRARKVLAETMTSAEANVMLAPFVNQTPDEAAAREAADLEDRQAESDAAVVDEPVVDTETDQGEITKLSRPAFDFTDAPWRSLVREGEGLVALIPKARPEESAVAEPESETSETTPAPQEPVVQQPVAPPSDSISSLFFDPPTMDSPPPETADPTPSKPTTKVARKERPKKSSAKRSGEMLDARLTTILQTYDPSTALSSYHCLRDALAAGHVPRPWLISRVGEALGRRAEHQKVVEIVQLLEHISDRGNAWSFDQTRLVHSDVIAAFAYCKDTVSTEYHKAYLLGEMGVRPTAQAYGALIFNGADSTGDASYAVKLWKEARQSNEVLHRHLFNGMIKAFGNVGKTDEAVQLLDQMRATQGRATPSWASYGFAIDACLQAGQLDRAKELYAQMQEETRTAQRRNFKPSILPFTSMMQHYATREPDRDALVRVDGDLRDLDLMPHSFTYEILINAYGSIAPVDRNTMWDVLELLEDNQTQHAQIQGLHWAAVIRSLGTDDFDASLATFELIEARPSSLNKNPPLPDVVCYEAILEVAEKASRKDVSDRIVQQMESSLMASTAKANLLIKTYGQAKDIASARKVFESTLDEPVDLVRPWRTDPSQPIPGPTAPIYRDAQTWETLIRLEAAEGNQAEAVALLQRMIALEWKPTLRPIATIRSLGELLSVETSEDGDEVEFSFERDVEKVKTITLEEQTVVEGEAGEAAVKESEDGQSSVDVTEEGRRKWKRPSSREVEQETETKA